MGPTHVFLLWFFYQIGGILGINAQKAVKTPCNLDKILELSGYVYLAIMLYLYYYYCYAGRLFELEIPAWKAVR